MTLEQNLSKQTVRVIKGILIGIGIILVIITVLAVHKLRVINTYDDYSLKTLVSHSFQVPATASDISYIEPWMTFAYVNHIFNVPDSYLAESLNITDTRYPRLVIGRYASMMDKSHQKILSEVKAALETYLASTTATSTNP